MRLGPNHAVRVVCPFCHSPHDTAAMVDHTSPMGPGDATLCLECGRYAVVRPDRTLRRPTKREAAQLAQSTDAWLLQQSWRAMKAMKRPPG